MIGKLERVPLREVWGHEAHHFTRWMEQNLDAVNDAVNLTLVSAEREKSLGAFSVDLVAEEAAGAVVVIENQLERSDHDHLGKLLTYMAGVEAQAAIWVVAHPRPEHVKAIAWLNDSTPYAFYLIQAEAVRIGDSPPAPLLTLIVGPGESKEQIGETKKELAERHQLRRQFWSELLERAKNRTKLHGGRSPTNDSWLGTGAGISGVSYTYVIRQRDARIELTFERGSEAENDGLFRQILDSRSQIEATFGGPLTWDRSEGRQMRRCTSRRPGATGTTTAAPSRIA